MQSNLGLVFVLTDILDKKFTFTVDPWQLTLKVTTAKDVEMSVITKTNTLYQDGVNLNDLHLQTCNSTPELKPLHVCLRML